MTVQKSRGWLSLILLGLLMTVAADPSLARLKGKLKKGVYLSPGGNFSVTVARGTRARDGYKKEVREGFVEFTDKAGRFNAIWYTPFELNETTAEIVADEERAARSFANYFRDVILPWIFHPISRESSVLSNQVLSFEGDPAYYFLVRVPGASGLWDVMTNERYDGRRATLLLNRCGYTYIVIHELVAGLGGSNRITRGDQITDAMIEEDMADGEQALTRFISNVSFSGCSPRDR